MRPTKNTSPAVSLRVRLYRKETKPPKDRGLLSIQRTKSEISIALVLQDPKEPRRAALHANAVISEYVAVCNMAARHEHSPAVQQEMNPASGNTTDANKGCSKCPRSQDGPDRKGESSCKKRRDDTGFEYDSDFE